MAGCGAPGRGFVSQYQKLRVFRGRPSPSVPQAWNDSAFKVNQKHSSDYRYEKRGGGPREFNIKVGLQGRLTQHADGRKRANRSVHADVRTPQVYDGRAAPRSGLDSYRESEQYTANAARHSALHTSPSLLGMEHGF